VNCPTLSYANSLQEQELMTSEKLLELSCDRSIHPFDLSQNIAENAVVVGDPSSQDHLAVVSDEVRLAQKTGRQTFMGIELEVMAGVLVPRQETELLGTIAVTLLRIVSRSQILAGEALSRGKG
jgi:hypothetical protein